MRSTRAWAGQDLWVPELARCTVPSCRTSWWMCGLGSFADATLCTATHAPMRSSKKQQAEILVQPGRATVDPNCATYQKKRKCSPISTRSFRGGLQLISELEGWDSLGSRCECSCLVPHKTSLSVLSGQSGPRCLFYPIEPDKPCLHCNGAREREQTTAS